MSSQERKPSAGRDARKVLLLACVLLQVGAARAAPVLFDIPRQSADTALTEFARQAGIPVLFPFDVVSGRTARVLRGRLEPEAALQILLKGTGLEARSDSQGQIVVREQPRVRRPFRSLNARLRDLETQPRIATDPEPIGEVTVTGSRIERDGMVTPTPVTSIYSGDLQAMGPGALVDALVQLPQFLNNDTPQTQAFGTGGAAGASFLNLRGVGSSRTLILLDGRRIVPTTRTGAVDVALLPRTLIERVEVVTGGASAAYGSDAVSGVVNVLLDRRADGLKLRAQTGISERGDAANNEWSATWGTPIGERSHFLFAGELARTDGIRGYSSREWFGSWAAIGNPDPAGPAEIVVRDARARGYTYGGLITRGPLAGTQFLEGGVPAPFIAGALATSTSQSGGSGVDPGRDLVWIQPDQTHGSAFAKYETGWEGGATFFAQTLLGYSDNAYDKDPASEWGPWEATIYADNAYLPASIRGAMQSAGIDRFPLGRMSTDLGPSRVHNRSRLLSSTVGFGLPLADGVWQVDGYFQVGRNRAQLEYTDAVRIDRVYRAFDSVRDPVSGRIVCRSTLSFPQDGCVPANPFGAGSISDAARAWITEGSSEQDQQVSQDAAELKVQGGAFELPAGTMSLALGSAWRHESVDNQLRRSPAELDGLIVLPASLEGYRGLPDAYDWQPNIFERTLYSTVRGGYSVWELFTESVWPLLRGAPGLRRLDLNTALRYAYYSGSGGVLAWKGGLDWRVSSEVRLRITSSRDVRAGSLAERFDATGSGSNITDPFIAGSPSYAMAAVRSGNPHVEPEKARTLTFGGVYQPAFVPALSMSADYYDIRIADAIGSLGAQAILDRCFAGNATFCGFVVRSPTNGLVTSINNSYLNIAEARSRGIDAELAWRQRVRLFGGDEGMALRIFANRVLEASTTSIAAPTVDRAGQTGLSGGAPRWQANLTVAYERGPLQLTVQERLVSPGTYNATYGQNDIDDNRVSGAAYTNLRMSWRWGREPGSFLLFANVTNLFDRNPPLAPDWGFVGSTHTNEGLFDVLGRRYTLGVRLRR